VSQSKNKRTLRPEILVPLLVAVIGLLGVMSAAFIANIDKWNPKSANQPPNLSNTNKPSPAEENPQQEYQLSGVVRDNDGPVSDVEIIAGTGTTHSAADGRFTIRVKGVAYELFRLQAYKEGYEDWRDDLQITPNDLLVIRLQKR
jgi:hypothetical protein